MKKIGMLLTLFTIVFLQNCTQKKTENSQSIENYTILKIEKTVFGQLPDGTIADLYTLKNANGMEVTISNYGGTITNMTAADKNGIFENITLACDSISGYLKGVPYFGALIGRYGNRIANGKFIINGKAFKLAKNNGPNALHGGIKGFDKVLWSAKPLEGEEPQLILNYTAADGEEGYPGKLEVEVTYTLQKENSLKIDYKATTNKTTVINLTNHTYFNLAGDMRKNILDNELTINADKYLPVNSTLIPTGELRPVVGTAFDFTNAYKIGVRINDSTDIQIKYGKGYDHCWILSDSSKSLKPAATVYNSVSGRVLEVFTTEPALQIYTGNFLDGTVVGKGGIAAKHRTGLCLETQHYPDSPNQPKFPSTVLNVGETYKSTTIYKFSVK